MGWLCDWMSAAVTAYAAFVPVPATLTAINDDNRHVEYHIKGQLGGQRVEYTERNHDEWNNLSYQGHLSARNADGSGYDITDRNNNLRLDNGDTITIFNPDGTKLKFAVDTSKPSLAKVVEGLQPKMDATLDSILAQNTLGLNGRR